MTQSVLLAVEAGIATLSFNRPGVMNAMDAEMMTEFRAAAELVERDPAVRAVVLKGEGKAFIAGGDVALFARRLAELPDIIVRWGREMHFAIQATSRAQAIARAEAVAQLAGAATTGLSAVERAAIRNFSVAP